MGQVPTAATTSLHAIYAEDALGSLELGNGGGKPSGPSGHFFLRFPPQRKACQHRIQSPPKMLGVKPVRCASFVASFLEVSKMGQLELTGQSVQEIIEGWFTLTHTSDL